MSHAGTNPWYRMIAIRMVVRLKAHGYDLTAQDAADGLQLQQELARRSCQAPVKCLSDNASSKGGSHDRSSDSDH